VRAGLGITARSTETLDRIFVLLERRRVCLSCLTLASIFTLRASVPIREAVTRTAKYPDKPIRVLCIVSFWKSEMGLAPTGKSLI
jgi:hypothetical protein